MIDNLSKEKGTPSEGRQTQDANGEFDDIYVRSRITDRSWWIRSAYILEKYRLVVLAVGAALGAIGFGFTTPKARYEEITKTQSIILVHQLKADSNITELSNTIRTLVVAQCMERSRTELAFMQLDCARYIQYRVDNPSARGNP